MSAKVTRKIVLLITALLIILGVRWMLKPSAAPETEKAWLHAEWVGMFTNIKLTAQISDSLQGESLIDSLQQLFSVYTQQVKTDSKLDSMIFNGQSGDSIALSTPWHCDLFRYGQNAFRQTHGSIHVGIGNLLHAYGLLWGMTPHMPTDTELDSILHEMHPDLFYQMPDSSCALILRRPHQRYALGSYSKGYALDLGAQLLHRHGIENFNLEAGGDLIVSGFNSRQADWRIGIQDPDQANGLLGAVEMPPQHAIASSGGYQKFFVDQKGQQHHHILDPHTGYSVADKKSTSAITPLGVDADFWATYLFVLPFDSACQLVEQTPKLEAIILSAQDSLFVSEGLRDRFHRIEQKP